MSAKPLLHVICCRCEVVLVSSPGSPVSHGYCSACVATLLEEK